MMAFEWIDAAGNVHTLDSPEKIELEYTRFSRELTDLKPLIQSASQAEYLDLRPRLERLRDRIIQLGVDLERYNGAWEAEIRRQSAEMSKIVKKLEAEVEYLEALHRCFDQSVSGPPTGRSGPTDDQIRVLRKLATRKEIPFVAPETFEAAQRELLREPATDRLPLPPSMPAFEWQDLNGHFHQIRTVMVIEKAFIELIEQNRMYFKISQNETASLAYIGIKKIVNMIESIKTLESQMASWSEFIIARDRDDMIRVIERMEEGNEKR